MVKSSNFETLSTPVIPPGNGEIDVITQHPGGLNIAPFCWLRVESPAIERDVAEALEIHSKEILLQALKAFLANSPPFGAKHFAGSWKAVE